MSARERLARVPATHIQHGTELVSFSSGTGTVTFPEEFEGVPDVVVTVLVAASVQQTASVNDRTTTGFTVDGFSGGSPMNVSRNIMWQAMYTQ